MINYFFVIVICWSLQKMLLIIYYIKICKKMLLSTSKIIFGFYLVPIGLRTIPFHLWLSRRGFKSPFLCNFRPVHLFGSQWPKSYIWNNKNKKTIHNINLIEMSYTAPFFLFCFLFFKVIFSRRQRCEILCYD